MLDESRALAAGLPVWVWLAIPILLYAFGVWTGVKERLVVFRNYHDVLVVGLLYLIPATAFGIAAFMGDSEEIAAALLVGTLCLEALVLLIVLARTWRDNPNPLKALLAFYVKLPTAILFFNALAGAFDRRSAKDRRKSVFWALLLAPLLHALVKDRKAGRLPALPRRR